MKIKVPLSFLSFFSLLFFLSFWTQGCSAKYYSIPPYLYPSTIEKSIQYFNYCLNHIEREAIFFSMEAVLIGTARKEFLELRRFVEFQGLSTGTLGVESIQITKKEIPYRYRYLNQPSFQKELLEYIELAKELKIQILDSLVEKNKDIKEIETTPSNSVSVRVSFYYGNWSWQDRKTLFLKKEKGLWKIESILKEEEKAVEPDVIEHE